MNIAFKVDIRGWLILYLLVLAALNILNVYKSENVEPRLIILFSLCCLMLVFGFFFIKPFYINTASYYSRIVRRIVVLSGITIIALYVYQGMPEPIKFRTDNQHTIGFFWIVLIAFLMVSAFFIRPNEYFFISFILLCIFLTGSRLNLLVFFVFFLSKIRINTKVIFTKILPLVLLLVFLSAAVGSFREGGRNFSLSGNFQELIDRNVALKAGLKVVDYDCFSNLTVESPAYLLVPRYIYPNKEVMFNIRAYMCYYDKQDIPSKSNGFFMTEMMLIFGDFVEVAAPLICLVYSMILSLMYNFMKPELKPLILPLLFLSVFGPIDGFYSSSVQIFLGVAVLFWFSMLYRLTTE